VIVGVISGSTYLGYNYYYKPRKEQGLPSFKQAPLTQNNLPMPSPMGKKAPVQMHKNIIPSKGKYSKDMLKKKMDSNFVSSKGPAPKGNGTPSAQKQNGIKSVQKEESKNDEFKDLEDLGKEKKSSKKKKDNDDFEALDKL
jgi:hypothetical protein